MSENNPWKYVRVDQDRIKNNPYFVKPSDTPDNSSPRENSSRSEDPIQGEYSFIEGSPYAKVVLSLQESFIGKPSDAHPKFTLDNGNKIYRPLTFKENIAARVNDYETQKDSSGKTRSVEDRTKLFLVYLDSCTGIAYKSNSTKFKINPVCKELVNIDANFNQRFLPIDYNKFTGVEFDSSNGKYNSLLTKTEFLEHEVYRDLYENDTNLMNASWDIVKSLTNKDNLMGFNVRQKTANDELRALYVWIIDGNSIANGNNYLNLSARFLRVARAKKLGYKNMTEFTLTKQISKQGSQSMIIIPAFLKDKLKPKMLVEIKIKVLDNSEDLQ